MPVINAHLNSSVGNGGNGVSVGQVLPFGNDREGNSLAVFGYAFILLSGVLYFRQQLVKGVMLAQKSIQGLSKKTEIDEEWQGAYCPIGRRNVICTTSVCSFT